MSFVNNEFGHACLTHLHMFAEDSLYLWYENYFFIAAVAAMSV